MNAHNVVRQYPRSTHRNRRGFTLLEMLIVITIILILMGLLMVAVNAAMVRARFAQVKADIGDLETAIANFKNTIGIEPPSLMTFYDSQAGWDSDPRSQGFIRRMWPQFDFSTSGGLTLSSPAVTLSGSECLVFFLGGVTDSSGAVTGFSTNPRLPFTTGGNRVGPFFEFEGGKKSGQWVGRFTDIDSDDAPEYKDPLSGQIAPYLYFSSYEGRGYASETNPSPPPSWRNSDCADVMAFCYYEVFDASSGPSSSRPHKPNSFQIISPGMDNQYGTGGLFDPNSPLRSIDPGADNITNFHNGFLSE